MTENELIAHQNSTDFHLAVKRLSEASLNDFDGVADAAEILVRIANRNSPDGHAIKIIRGHR